MRCVCAVRPKALGAEHGDGEDDDGHQCVGDGRLREHDGARAHGQGDEQARERAGSDRQRWQGPGVHGSPQYAFLRDSSAKGVMAMM